MTNETAYHQLTVTAIRDETSDAKSFYFTPQKGEEEHFNYQSGQFLSFHIPYGEGVIVRSYSLSSAPTTNPDMVVCVKRVEGGRGSNWFNDHLKEGMTIEAHKPAGRFVLREGDAPLLVIAGGSGITPCISLAKHALAETKRRVKLVYANQNASSVIYREQLDELEASYPDRFTCQHWLDDKLGFLTADDITKVASGWGNADSYICGPGPLMDLAEDTLVELFDEEAYIQTERFISPDDPTPGEDDVPAPSGDALIESFRLTLDDEEHSVPIAAGETLLDAALAAGIDAPTSCGKGTCGTCMGQLREGDVSMGSTKALSKRDKEKGYILACQARPASTDPIWLDFDI